MPELEVAYQKFLNRVYKETKNPEWNIENHPAHKILSRYPDSFRNWVDNIENLIWLKKGGYPFEKNDLEVLDWKAMALIENLRIEDQLK